MMTLLQDLRYGLRTLARSPGFAFVAVATLALGIGANAAIFSAVNAVLLRPLPYAQPDELVMVWQDLRARGGPAHEWATPGNVVDWKGSGIFSGVAAVQGWQATITGDGDPEPLVGEQVTFDYFDVLGVRPALGRTFRLEEDVPNAARVVVISDALWHRRFGGRRDAVGRRITIGGEAHEIIGVMPASFRPAVLDSATLWRPRRLDLAQPSRGAVVLRVIARLKAGATIEQTSASTALLASQLAAAYPEWNTATGIALSSLHAEVVGEARQGLLIVLAAVGFVLLIACANIANLLLARATARTREIAVRLALGAGRRRLIRQLLTESLLLSAIGGAAGIMLGAWGIDALVAVAPSGAPRLGEVGVDGRVLWFASALALGTGVLFGLVPALQASRADVTPSLREGGRGAATAGGYRTRRALIVFEVAAAVVLLVAGGLLLRTFATLQASNLGFTADRVLVGAVNPPRAAYATRAQQVAFYDRLLDRVSSLPGVETAALSSVVPLGGDSDMSVLVEGRPLPRNDAESDAVWYRLVSADYFRAMQIPLTRGRTFAPREAAPAVVVSEPTARRFWKDENPIGRRIRFGSGDDAPWFTVVGVAGEVRMRGPRGESRSEVYLPYWQFPELGTNVILKSSGRPDALAAPLRQTVREIDPDLPVASIRPMTAIVAESIEQPRFLALLVGLFAASALVLAAVGIYGLIAFAVAQRTQEIGVRMALGAGRGDVVRLVVFDAMKLTAIGLALGAAGAAAVAESLQSQLFGVTPIDPATFAVAALALGGTAIVACLIPAVRAARVDPMVALRAE